MYNYIREHTRDLFCAYGAVFVVLAKRIKTKKGKKEEGREKRGERRGETRIVKSKIAVTSV